MTQSPDFPELSYVAALGDGNINGGEHRPMTQMVVIHATDNTASDENEAAYASHRPDETSAHFYNDADSITQAVRLDCIAYGCFSMGNSRSVQFELTGLSNQVVEGVMQIAAPYVAKVCAHYGLPLRKIGAADLVNGARGICGHGDVTAAWRQGDHTDPGSAFPWDHFIQLVQIAAGQQPNVPQPPAPSGLVVDGVLGPLTISAWQRRMGTSVDGYITQPPGKSSLVMAVQRYLNQKIGAGLVVDGVGIRQDGRSVFLTTRALQRYLGTGSDGKLDVPTSYTVKVLQEHLNAGTF